LVQSSSGGWHLQDCTTHTHNLLPKLVPVSPKIPPQGDVTIIRLLLKAHAKLLELTAGSDHRLRDPRRIPDGYGKTAYTIAFDLGRWVRSSNA
jgi:hypothetical protein